MCGEIRGQRPHGAAPLPTSNRQKIMGKYLVKTFSTIRKTNGDTIRHEGFSKVVSEKVLELAKQANKEVGYKYAGRGKDWYDNGYTQYKYKPKDLQTKECEVIYIIRIMRLV